MKTFLRSVALAVALVVVGGLLASPPASANINGVTVFNKSDRCAWITIYWAPNFYIPYMIANRNDAERPQFVKPGESHKFPTGDVAEMKVRAEVTKNADCSGGTIKDTYDIRKDSNSEKSLQLKAHLMNTSNGYNLWFFE